MTDEPRSVSERFDALEEQLKCLPLLCEAIGFILGGMIGAPAQIDKRVVYDLGAKKPSAIIPVSALASNGKPS